MRYRQAQAPADPVRGRDKSAAFRYLKETDDRRTAGRAPDCPENSP
jgi:hypothetical protein